MRDASRRLEGASSQVGEALSDAIARGHGRPKAELGDTFLYRGQDTLLSRAAWIDGLGSLVKTAMPSSGSEACQRQPQC